MRGTDRSTCLVFLPGLFLPGLTVSFLPRPIVFHANFSLTPISFAFLLLAHIEYLHVALSSTPRATGDRPEMGGGGGRGKGGSNSLIRIFAEQDFYSHRDADSVPRLNVIRRINCGLTRGRPVRRPLDIRRQIKPANTCPTYKRTDLVSVQPVECLPDYLRNVCFFFFFFQYDHFYFLSIIDSCWTRAKFVSRYGSVMNENR